MKYYLGPRGLMTESYGGGYWELQCYQSMRPGPFSGFLEDQPVQFFALLFNHFAGEAGDTCYLLFVTRNDGSGSATAPSSYSPIAIGDAYRHFNLQGDCSDAAALNGARLTSMSLRLDEQVRAPYVPPASCASAAPNGEALVAPWLQGTASRDMGDRSSTRGLNVTLSAHDLLEVEVWKDPNGQLQMAQATLRCIRNATTIAPANTPSAMPVAQVLDVTPYHCMYWTVMRNASASAETGTVYTYFRQSGELNE